MNNADPIPVGVVGAGNMGLNHIRVYDEIPGADLVEIVEPDQERAAKVRENYNVNVLDDISDIKRSVAVTIAVPNRYHRDVAVDIIDRGIHVLVEKPLAMNVEDAQAIVDAAAANDVRLQVGHIERFNPAVQALDDILSEEKIIALEAHRLGPFNEHLTDESVVFDLMIHDVDIIRSLIGAPVDHVDAVGARPKSNEIDHAVAHLKFGNGVLGTMTSSHVTHSKVRTLSVTTREMYIELDYQRQHIAINRRGTEETTLLQGKSGYRTETIQETPFIRTREPLKNELESFVESIQADRTPTVSGEEALEAVRLASKIIDTIDTN